MTTSIKTNNTLLLPVRTLLSTAALSTVVRGFGPLSSLLLTLLLARMFGAAETGAFYLLVVLMTSAAIIARLGFDTSLQRFIGAAVARHDWALVNGLYKQAISITSLISLLLAGIMVSSSTFIADKLLGEPEQQTLVIWMSLTIIPFTLMGVHAAMLKAVGRPVWGGFIEAAALPIMTIILVAVVRSGMLPLTLTISTIGFAFFIGAMSASLLGAYLFLKFLPLVAKTDFIPRQQLMASCLPLMQVELLNYANLWLPMLLLGVLDDTSSAGLYNIAQRLSGQLSMLLLVFAAITASRFAAHHQAGEQKKLLALATNTTRSLSLLGLPLILLFLIWPQDFLALFGEQFVAADTILRILVIGQLVNLTTGPGGYLLAMTGHEHLLRNMLFLTVLMTLLLSLLLIPVYGVTGAAIAVTIPMIMQNLVNCLFIRQRLGMPFFLLFAPIQNRS